MLLSREKRWLRLLRQSLADSPWKSFSLDVRAKQANLLCCLDDFHDAILVTGCQRSGTTMLSRVIRSSEGFVNYWTSRDDEYDAACILAGIRAYNKQQGRYCFQTTYLNERFSEYYEHDNYRMIWVLRNPYSVIYSMLNNWGRFALNELFLSVGVTYMLPEDRVNFLHYGLRGVSVIRRAAYAYNGKVSQLFDLVDKLPPKCLAIVEYDNLVINKQSLLPRIYSHIGHPYRSVYLDLIHEGSVGKKNSLTDCDRDLVDRLSYSIYMRALQTLTIV